MIKSLQKYYLKFLSIILVFALLIPGIVICNTVIENCKTSQRSCCEKSSAMDDNCCCEIKQASNQPAELNPNPNLIKCLVDFTVKSFSDNEISVQNPKISQSTSFHPPPQKEIYIINSNLRI